jgi:flagellar biosynthesis protein FliQ
MVITPLNLSVQALKLLFYCAAPVLFANIIVGVIMAIVQAITHIQDSSLSFVPKALVTALVFFIFHDRMFHAFQIFFHHIMQYVAMY